MLKQEVRKRLLYEVTLLKWSLRIIIAILLTIGVLIVVVLNPTLLYAHKATIGTFAIYYNDSLDSAFPLRLQEAAALTRKSEVANPGYRIEVCLGRSIYPSLIERLFGKGFAWGFSNKIVIAGQVNAQGNYHKSRWNLSQLLAHEMTHCLQFKKYGLFKSNPLAGYPVWKWEGYAEYAARQSNDQKSLSKNIERLLRTEQTENDGFVYFADGTRTVIPYYKDWLLVQYCMDVKEMSYDQVLKDTTSAVTLEKQMMDWYRKSSLNSRPATNKVEGTK